MSISRAGYVNRNVKGVPFSPLGNQIGPDQTTGPKKSETLASCSVHLAAGFRLAHSLPPLTATTRVTTAAACLRTISFSIGYAVINPFRAGQVRFLYSANVWPIKS